MLLKNLYRSMALIVALVTIFYVLLYFLGFAPTKTGNIFDPLTGKVTFVDVIDGGFDDPMNKPMDVNKIGNNIYVSDNKNQRVVVFNSNGEIVQKIGKEGTGEGEFTFPYGIAGDSKNNVYVADMKNGKISIFDKSGKFVKYFKEAELSLGITSPTGIRIVDDKLYVLNLRPALVMIYDLDGKRLYASNSTDKGNEYLNAPNAIAVDDNGDVYVSESGAQRVSVYNSKLEFKKIVDGSVDGKGHSVFVNPRGIGITKNGNLYVVDNSANRVFAFDKNGKTIDGFGEQGDGAGQFSLPNGLYVDEDNNIYVTDTFNQRVQIFK